MAVKNGYRSNRGRSAIARKVLFSGPGKVDGVMPQGQLVLYDWSKNTITRTPKRWGGGIKKGGAPPSSGYLNPFGKRSQISASRGNFAFYSNFRNKTNPYGLYRMA